MQTNIDVPMWDEDTKAILTLQVDVLLAGQPYTAVELPQDKLVLSGFPDVLHLAAVVGARAVVPDAV